MTEIYHTVKVRQSRAQRRYERCRYQVQQQNKSGNWPYTGVHRSRLVAIFHAWFASRIQFSHGTHVYRVIDTKEATK